MVSDDRAAGGAVGIQVTSVPSQFRILSADLAVPRIQVFRPGDRAVCSVACHAVTEVNHRTRFAHSRILLPRAVRLSTRFVPYDMDIATEYTGRQSRGPTPI